MRVETIESASAAPTKDYRVTVKVRNNRILKAIEEVGGRPGAKWCEENGLPYTTVNGYIALKESPINEEGKLRISALRLCEAVNKIPDELWSAEQLYPLEKNFAELEMDGDEVKALIESKGHLELDDDGVIQRQYKEIVKNCLDSVTDRQAMALRLVYLEEKTLSEAGKEMEITGYRVSQVCDEAMRKIRKKIVRGVMRKPTL